MRKASTSSQNLPPSHFDPLVLVLSFVAAMQTQISLTLWNFFIHVVSILCPVVFSYCDKGIETGAEGAFEGSANEGEEEGDGKGGREQNSS